MLRTLTALEENADLVPIAHMAAHICNSPVPGNSAPPPDRHRHWAHMWYTGIHKGKYAHIENFQINLKT